MVALDKSADFIVLDANPLENIANTRKIAGLSPRPGGGSGRFESHMAGAMEQGPINSIK
jgi:imidazolonepropionase-like amidohydrolase